MKFSATLHGTTYYDPKEFAAAVKTAPPLKPGPARVGRNIPIPTYTSPPKPQPIFKKPRVILTAAEREWLGATVRRSDGSVGQVWALAPLSGYVWVVADGDFWFQTHVGALELVQSRVDQLALDA